MSASALAGLALTYYYDNPANQKLMNILQARCDPMHRQRS